MGKNARVFPDHLLADALGARVDVIAVGDARLVQSAAGRREPARGNRAREDEAAELEALGELEDVAQPLDVGSPVLGVLLPGEIVVGGQVQQHVRAAARRDPLEHAREGFAFADVDLRPGDVGVHRCAAVALRTAPEADDPIALLDLLEEVAADEAGGARNDDAGKRHCWRYCSEETPRRGGRAAVDNRCGPGLQGPIVVVCRDVTASQPAPGQRWKGQMEPPSRESDFYTRARRPAGAAAPRI